MADDREPLGRLVRETWDACVRDLIEDPKPSWIAPWEELDDFQREADMRIGEAVARYALTENAITWDTLCPRCAGFLDRANDERERAERAEAKLALIAAHCRDRVQGSPGLGMTVARADVILGIIGGSEPVTRLCETCLHDRVLETVMAERDEARTAVASDRGRAKAAEARLAALEAGLEKHRPALLGYARANLAVAANAGAAEPYRAAKVWLESAEREGDGREAR